MQERVEQKKKKSPDQPTSIVVRCNCCIKHLPQFFCFQHTTPPTNPLATQKKAARTYEIFDRNVAKFWWKEVVVYAEAAGASAVRPRAPLGKPIWKPLEKRRETVLR
jgi:hypothetical protein